MNPNRPGAFLGLALEEYARVFAAAPDLLRGCQAALAYLADPASMYAENREAAKQILLAAISKAEGRGEQ